MQPPTAYFREMGSGPGVVCLHANASTSGQWRTLMETLAPKFHVLAADSFGAGRSPAWPTEHPVALQDEVELLQPVFARAGDPFVLVAHSYGAAVALIAAVSQPQRIRAMALYEPTLFALLDGQSAPPNDADGIRAAVAASSAALDAGDPDRAAECFIDFWMGQGAWAQMPEARKAPIAASVVNVRGWARALMTEPTPLAAFCAAECSRAVHDGQGLAGVVAWRGAAAHTGVAASASRRVRRHRAHGARSHTRTWSTRPLRAFSNAADHTPPKEARMSKPQLPNIGDALGPIVAQVPAEQRPLLIAAAERLAAERYRRWAREVAEAEHRAGLLACADREDEIATRIESLFPNAASAQRELLASVSGLDEIGPKFFDPYTIEQQFRIQAQGERLGAATWRSFARHAGSPQSAALFESCAILEEESAAFLESIAT